VLSADVRFTVAQKHFAVNLQLKEGLYLVMGPNGAGKTTFLRVLLGLFPFEGTINMDKPLGYIPQHYQPLNASVEDNLRLFDVKNLPDNSPLQSKKRLNAMKLSGGEKAMLGLTQVMALQPKTLLVDEITAHLDQPSTIMIENTLKDYGRHAVVLLVTHQWDTLLRLKVPTLLFLNNTAQLLPAEDAYSRLLETLR